MQYIYVFRIFLIITYKTIIYVIVVKGGFVFFLNLFPLNGKTVRNTELRSKMILECFWVVITKEKARKNMKKFYRERKNFRISNAYDSCASVAINTTMWYDVCVKYNHIRMKPAVRLVGV